MDNFRSNMILVAQEDDAPEKNTERKSKKKGDGINAVLTLLKELRDFQDRVTECSEAQEITDNKSKVDQFNEYLDSMAETLLDIAKGAIVRGREKDSGEAVAPPVEEKPAQIQPKTNVTAPMPPSGPIMSSVIHQLPR